MSKDTEPIRLLMTPLTKSDDPPSRVGKAQGLVDRSLNGL